MTIWRFRLEDGTPVDGQGETREEALADARRRYTGRTSRNADDNVLGDLGDSLSVGFLEAAGDLPAALSTIPRAAGGVMDILTGRAIANRLTLSEEQRRGLDDARYGGLESGVRAITRPWTSTLRNAADIEALSQSDAHARRALAASEWANNPFSGEDVNAGDVALGILDSGVRSLPGMGIGIGVGLLTGNPVAPAAIEAALASGQTMDAIAGTIQNVAYEEPEVFRNSELGRWALSQTNDYDRAVELAIQRGQEIAPAVGITTGALSRIGGDWVDKVGLIRRNVLGAIAREASEETLQSGSEQVYQNIAVRGADPRVGIGDNVVGAMVQGGILGGAMGGLGGGITQIAGRDQQPPPPPPPPTPTVPPPITPAPSPAPQQDQGMVDNISVEPPPFPSPRDDEEPRAQPEPGPTPRVFGDLDYDENYGVFQPGELETEEESLLSRDSSPLYDIGVPNTNDVPRSSSDWYRDEAGNPVTGQRVAIRVPLYSVPDPTSLRDEDNLVSRFAARAMNSGTDPELTRVGQTLARAARDGVFYQPDSVPEGAEIIGEGIQIIDVLDDDSAYPYIAPRDFSWDESQIPTKWDVDPRLQQAAPAQEQTQPEPTPEPAPVAQEATQPVPAQEQPEARVAPGIIRDLSERIDDPAAAPEIEAARQQIIARGENATEQEREFLLLSENTDQVPEFTPPAGVEIQRARTKDDGREFDVTVPDRTQIVDTGYSKLRARAGKDSILSMDGKPYSVVTPEVMDATYERLPNGKVKARVGREVPYYIAPEDSTIPSKEGPVQVKAGDPVIQGPAGEWYPPGGMANFQRKFDTTPPPVVEEAETEAQDEDTGLSDFELNAARRLGSTAAATGKSWDQLLRTRLKGKSKEYIDEALAAYEEYNQEEETDEAAEEQPAKPTQETNPERGWLRAKPQDRVPPDGEDDYVPDWIRRRGQASEESQQEMDRFLGNKEQTENTYSESLKPIITKLLNDDPLTREEVALGRKWKAERLNASDLSSIEKQFSNLSAEFSDAAAALRPARRSAASERKESSKRDAAGFDEVFEDGGKGKGVEPGSPEALQQEIAEQEKKLADAEKASKAERNNKAIERKVFEKMRDSSLLMFGPPSPTKPKWVGRYPNAQAALEQYWADIESTIEASKEPGAIPATVLKGKIAKAYGPEIANLINDAWKRDMASLGRGYGGRQLPVDEPKWSKEMQEAIKAAAKCSAAQTVGGAAGAAALAVGMADPLAATSYILAGAMAVPVAGAAFIEARRRQQIDADATRQARDFFNVVPLSQVVDPNPETWAPSLDEAEEFQYDPDTYVDADGNVFRAVQVPSGANYAGAYKILNEDNRVIDTRYEPSSADQESQRTEEEDAEFSRRLMDLVEEFRSED